MKICYDYQTFSDQKVGGISRYFKYLLDGLKAQGHQSELATLFSDNIYLDEKDFPSTLSKLNFLIRTNKKKVKYNQRYANHAIKKGNYDIFHPTYFNPYYLKNCKSPVVLTVHDMTYEALPQLFPLTDYTPLHKRLTMTKADKIIAISEQTKSDILTYTNIKEDVIEVIYHGIDQNASKYEPVRGLPENYILFVGGRWCYKNFFLTVDAFQQINKIYPEIKLVLAGGGNLSYGDSEYIIRKGLQEQIVHFKPTDAQLNTMYKNALCFIYPSSYEGFGFPILEAFKNNCPTLLSNIKCFKEVAADAAYYFQNGNLEDLVCQLKKVITHRNPQLALQKDRLALFSIEKCVNKTIKLYKTLC